MNNKQIYLHLTDKEGALGIRDSKTLWSSSIIEGVYAIAKGGRFVPEVQMTRLGRAKSRLIAVYFTTPILPDYCTPEECVWKLPEIPVEVVKITNAIQAKKDLDGSLGVLNDDSYRARLLIPTKEMPDPTNPPDFLINEIKILVENIIAEEIEEAAKTPEEAAGAELGIYRMVSEDRIELFLFNKKKLALFTGLRDLLRMSQSEFETESLRLLGPEAKSLKPKDIKDQAEKMLQDILIGQIYVNKTDSVTEDGDNIWRVSESAAEKGYGPLLYESIMYLLGEDWFGPDARSSSDPAQRVWNKFLERPDIQRLKITDHDTAPSSHVYRLGSTAQAARFRALANNSKEPSNQLTNPVHFFRQLGAKFFIKKYRALFGDNK